MAAFFTTLITKIAESLLKWALSRSIKEVQKTIEQKEKEKSNAERNERNAVKYEQAKTRAEKIQAALDLINRNN